MTTITDVFMRDMLSTTKRYAVVILRRGANSNDRVPPKIWEHGRRNFALREARKLVVVMPLEDDADVRGICIFNTDPEEARRIMVDDPAVKAGVLAFEVHPCRGFPGDALPQ
jgi:hypothetical protein